MPSVRSAVTSCIRPGPDRAEPQQPAAPSLIAVGLMVFCFFLPDTNARRPGRFAWAADLHLGAVDAQLHALGGGVGEHIGQRPQPQPGLAGHGEPAGREQRPDLPHGPGDGGAVHPVEQRERGVRELEPQHDQGGDHPVGERQLLAGARALGAQPVLAPALPQPRLLLRQPRGRPAPRSACPGGDGRCRCRYDATRPRGPILTTHLDRSARPFTFPGPTHQDHPLRAAISYRAPSR